MTRKTIAIAAALAMAVCAWAAAWTAPDADCNVTCRINGDAAARAAVAIDRCSEIVVREGAPYATRLAAEELNFFLKGVLGAPLPVVTRKTGRGTAIVLGGADGRDGLAAPRDRDGYVIEARDGAVRISGNDDDPRDPAATAALPDEAPWQPCFRRGTLFGVYAFLERFAGVRMYFPGELGTCVPRAERIAVPEGRIEEAPAFSVRRYGYADGPVPHDLLAGLDETAFKRLNWYRLRMETSHLRCCHGAKTHCLSPETWDSIYAAACAIVGGRRGAEGQAPVFDAMPKDGLTWARHCNCGWCTENIPFSSTDTGFATDIVWRRTAELADRLAARFPGARVSQMSYIPYARIPTNDIPGNVDVFVARRGPWAEGTAIGAREKDEVRRWHEKLGRKVSLWNYPDKVDCWNLEMKDIPQFAPRAWARYYRAVAPHATGAFAESESDRWLYNYLNYYVFSRVCWNPEADAEAILAEHHRLMFGAAAREMAAFFDTLEVCWMTVVAHPCDTPLGPGVCKAPTEKELRTKIYSPETLSRLAALLRTAEAKTAPGSLAARRIALFRREFLEPLCRKFGVCAASAPADGPPGTEPRAVRIGLVADIHIGDGNDNSDLKRALRLFDAKKADAVMERSVPSFPPFGRRTGCPPFPLRRPRYGAQFQGAPARSRRKGALGGLHSEHRHRRRMAARVRRAVRAGRAPYGEGVRIHRSALSAAVRRARSARPARPGIVAARLFPASRVSRAVRAARPRRRDLVGRRRVARIPHERAEYGRRVRTRPHLRRQCHVVRGAGRFRGDCHTIALLPDRDVAAEAEGRPRFASGALHDRHAGRHRRGAP